MIAISLGTPEGLGQQTHEAAYWIAAFLSGFSERFGSDIVVKPDAKGE
jgi:hypothetical protein